ncbi:Exonuclease [Candidatus Desulfarcum epimagneticum]|uniref:Exonuclease n=1 Tax=uncultured Desulfobacteraceae bacterium TaxID=218296 RepID=A0A484HBQ4_9BACT|nr:Exonuclease [uncultured Desulfobacteraceae bacterium]
MHVTFYGAAREVTGSMHLFSAGGDRILFDCGIFQGRRKECEHKNRTLPFDPSILSAVVLSHAHIDHSGRIPMLTKGGKFSGRVVCTRPTVAACEYLLPDSAHIQESDAAYLNYKTLRKSLSGMKQASGNGKSKKSEEKKIREMLKKGSRRPDMALVSRLMKERRIEVVRPIYTTDEALGALEHFDGYPYQVPVKIGDHMTCRFYDAGHILGSAFSVVRASENGKARTLLYTGDIGRFDKPIINDPTLVFEDEDRDIDLMIMESTYGDRLHGPVADLKPRLGEIISRVAERGGTILIPSFAYGRTQELLYVLHELYNEGGAPRLPVYVDSPLATHITRVFGEHPESYDRETHETFLEKGLNPFFFSQVKFVESVEESMALMRDETPHIVLSASGMCEAGRILHHLRYKIHNPKNAILIVGYMAQNTFGRKIQELGAQRMESGKKGPAPLVKFFNKTYPLKADVFSIGGFSAHADKNEMLRFLKESNLNVKKIAVVHGENDQSLSFAETLRNEGFEAQAPMPGETIEF